MSAWFCKSRRGARIGSEIVIYRTFVKPSGGTRHWHASFVWTKGYTFLAQQLVGRHITMGTSALAIVCYVAVAALYFGFLAFVALRGRGESEAGANSQGDYVAAADIDFDALPAATATMESC
jgi:hypothetical protein